MDARNGLLWHDCWFVTLGVPLGKLETGTIHGGWGDTTERSRPLPTGGWWVSETKEFTCELCLRQLQNEQNSAPACQSPQGLYRDLDQAQSQSTVHVHMVSATASRLVSQG